MNKYKVEKVSFSMLDLEELQELTPHVEDKKRTFFIFPKDEETRVIWYAIEDSYFRNADGEINIPLHFEVPRWRLLKAGTLSGAIRLCKAQVEVDYLVSTGMDPMEAAHFVVSRMIEEEAHHDD